MKTARLGPGNLCKNNSSQNSQDTATVSWSEALASIFRSWARRSSCWQSCTCLCSYLLYLWYSQMFVAIRWNLHLWMVGDIITSWKRDPSIVIFDYQTVHERTGPAIFTEGGKSWYDLMISPADVKLTNTYCRFPTSPENCVISFLATFTKVYPRKTSPIN